MITSALAADRERIAEKRKQRTADLIDQGYKINLLSGTQFRQRDLHQDATFRLTRDDTETHAEFA